MGIQEQRDDWQERRVAVEERYEDALIDAKSAPIGTTRFLHAMAEVRAVRDELLNLEADRPT